MRIGLLVPLFLATPVLLANLIRADRGRARARRLGSKTAYHAPVLPML